MKIKVLSFIERTLSEYGFKFFLYDILFIAKNIIHEKERECMKTLKISPREEALEKITNYIAINKLKPNDKLPSERDLCKLWGVNRMTLRSAIQSLIAESILYNKVGSGTYVAPEKLERNLQDLKSFSKTVGEAGLTLTTKVISKRIVECNKQISKKLNKKLGQKVLELIRLRNVDGIPVMIETTYLDLDKFNGIEQYDFEVESLYNILEENYDTSITSGNEKIGITYVSEEEAELLNVDHGIPVFLISGVVYDLQGEPIEYFKTISRSDKMRYSSVLNHSQ